MTLFLDTDVKDNDFSSLPFAILYVYLFLLGYIWAEDKEHCEEYGRMLQADPSKVSMRAKKRGLPQVGNLAIFNLPK